MTILLFVGFDIDLCLEMLTSYDALIIGTACGRYRNLLTGPRPCPIKGLRLSTMTSEPSESMLVD